MSMYGDYLKEKTNDDILETDRGFATYRFLEHAVYIINLYVLPEYRKLGEAARMADAIAMAAKEKGITKMLGTVIPSNKGSTESIKVLVAYGMKISSSSNDLLVFEKEI